MAEDVFGFCFYVLWCVFFGQAGLVAVEKVTDGCPHGGTGRFFFAPLVDAQFANFQFFEQADGHFFYVRDFALFFADYDCGEGFAHPVDFPLQVCSFLFVRCPR